MRAVSHTGAPLTFTSKSSSWKKFPKPDCFSWAQVQDFRPSYKICYISYTFHYPLKWNTLSSAAVAISWANISCLILSIGSRSCKYWGINSVLYFQKKGITACRLLNIIWPASHQIFHHVCGRCSLDQTWSVHGTCKYPSQGSICNVKNVKS